MPLQRCLLASYPASVDDPGLSGYQKAVLRQSGVKSSVAVVDTILGEHMALMLSKADFDGIRNSAKLGSALTAKLERLLPDECFIMVRAVGAKYGGWSRVS